MHYGFTALYFALVWRTRWESEAQLITISAYMTYTPPYRSSLA